MFGNQGKTGNVGIIGLGIIGSRVAERLRQADHHVFVWSRTVRSEPNFMASAREVAEVTQVVQIFVRDATALNALMTEIKPVLTSQHTLLVHSTVSRTAIQEAAAIATEAGADFLDAPFTGSKIAAAKGELVYYIGGEESVLEKVRPILEASSKKILHLGAVGNATVLKIATNLVSAAVVQALAEALAIVKGQGIPAEKLLEAMIPNANCSPLVTMKLPTMISGNFEPHFTLENMLKDARYAQELARGKNLVTPILDGSAKAMDKAMKNGGAKLDYSIVGENYNPFKIDPSTSTKPAKETKEKVKITLKSSRFENADADAPATNDATAPGTKPKS